MASNIDIASLDLDEALDIHPHTGNKDSHGSLGVPMAEMDLTGPPSPTASQLMKDKHGEWEGPRSQGMPLTLLDLPVDVLRLIVNEASTDPSRSSVDIHVYATKVTC